MQYGNFFHKIVKRKRNLHQEKTNNTIMFEPNAIYLMAILPTTYKCVPKIVKSKAFYPCPFTCIMESSSYILDRSAVIDENR
jgi:hypothetical protein